MYFQRPPGLFNLPDLGASFQKRRWRYGEGATFGSHLACFQRVGNLTITLARRRIGSKTTIAAGKCDDGGPSVLQTFSEQLWRDVQYLCRLGTFHFHNLTEHIREPMRPVKTLEHSDSAANLDFFD